MRRLFLIRKLLLLPVPIRLYQNSGGLVTTREIDNIPGHDEYELVWNKSIAKKLSIEDLKYYINIARNEP